MSAPRSTENPERVQVGTSLSSSYTADLDFRGSTLLMNVRDCQPDRHQHHFENLKPGKGRSQSPELCAGLGDWRVTDGPLFAAPSPSSSVDERPLPDCLMSRLLDDFTCVPSAQPPAIRTEVPAVFRRISCEYCDIVAFTQRPLPTQTNYFRCT